MQEVEAIGFDVNSTSSVTDSIEMEGSSSLGFYVTANTGTNATHVVTLQISMDDTNWTATAHTVTGAGNIHNLMCVTRFVRLKCTTAEGSPATVDLVLIVK